jgi:hypothetical protein
MSPVDAMVVVLSEVELDGDLGRGGEGRDQSSAAHESEGADVYRESHEDLRPCPRNLRAR